MSNFVDRIRASCESRRSLLCVGLDPDPELMPVSDVFQFNQAIVDATSDLTAAYKPNLAFYEALGLPGLGALERTVDYIRSAAPHALVIGDAKRGDIGPSARAYARAMFAVWGFDAITANAWGGHDTVVPLLEDERKGVFIWCRGSNLGSADFQDAVTGEGSEALPLYRKMAQACARWNVNGNVGLVAGATVPEQLSDIREACPDMPLLVPGVGAQGGDLEAAVRRGTDAAGRLALINSSRGIIYASRSADFAAAARQQAAKLKSDINRILDVDGWGWP